MDNKLKSRLDKLLGMYYHASASQGEKDNSLSVFKKMCVSNNVDHESYMKTCCHNPKRERSSSQNSRESGSRPSGRYNPSGFNSQDGNFGGGFEDFFKEFYGGFGRRAERESGEARAKREAEESFEREYNKRREEARKRDEERKQAEWNRSRDRWKNLIFEMKEPMFEEKYHNGKRVILLNTLSREYGTNRRFGIQNFCIYSEEFNPYDFLKLDVVYKIECDRVQYFRDHNLIRRMMIIGVDGYEIEIYASEGYNR